MSNKKLKIAYLKSAINNDSKRGASRLFSVLINGLSQCENVDLYEIYDRMPEEFNPINTIFKVKKIQIEKSIPWHETEKLDYDFFTKSYFMDKIYRIRSLYRKYVPKIIRYFLKPINYFIHKTAIKLFRYINKVFPKIKIVNNYINEINEFNKNFGIPKMSVLEISYKMFIGELFIKNPNEKLNVEYCSLNDFDAILNFWWFHSRNINEIIHLFKTCNAPIYAWFLDAIPLRIPHWQDGLISESVFKPQVQIHLALSDRVIALSQSAALDAQIFFHVPKEKIQVIPCGIFSDDFLNPDDIDGTLILNKYAIKREVPIILSIGVQEPSKNTINIIKACMKLVNFGVINVQLVFIGETRGFDPFEKYGVILKKLANKINVVFTGSISEEEKKTLLAKASVFLYPSLWEGFGIPPLEAMAAKVPIVTSYIASLPEVCQEHVWYCDPYDPTDIFEKLKTVLLMEEVEMSEKLNKACQYAKEFIWEIKAIPMLVDDIYSFSKKNRQ